MTDIAKTTRPYLRTREAAAARIETLEAALRDAMKWSALIQQLVSTALASEQDK